MSRMKTLHHTRYESPLGPILLTSDGQQLTGLYFEGQKWQAEMPSGVPANDAPFREVIKALDRYFAGKARTFDIATTFNGTALQQAVWRALQGVSCGETLTYAQLAQRVGKPKAVRAVANAVGRNPISIIVPCHRIIGSNGSLTGYAGGLDRKRQLLALEGAL